MNTTVVDQSRIGSLVEAWVNVLIGFWINFFANLVILPMFGFTSLTVATNFVIGLLYTVISVARSYVIRRWFNAYLKRMAERIAQKIGD